MFVHNFKYSLITLLKNKMLIFWTLAFPIILGTLFNMAFADIENSEKLAVIDIAIVTNEEFKNNALYKKAFSELGDKKNEDRLFNIEYVNEKEAKKMLNEDKISGYLVLTDRPKVVVTSSGINETVFKYVTEEISQTESILKNKINNEIRNKNEVDYEKIYEEVLNIINSNEKNIKDTSSNNLSYTMIEFYTLIAMACLYGGILGMVSINQNLANMTNNGKRVAVSSISKFKMVLSSVLASYLVQVIGIVLLFIYTLFVLNVDYGNNLLLVILLALIGCLAGLSIGIFVACLFKTNDNIKTGIIISFTMLGCFLSGMMGITMKYYVDKYVPIINKLNPASMITDGFYALYYYDTLDRFIFNIVSLLIFSFILIGVSMFSLRRQKYDSI